MGRPEDDGGPRLVLEAVDFGVGGGCGVGAFPFHASSAARIAMSAPRWSFIFRRLSMSACDPT